MTNYLKDYAENANEREIKLRSKRVAFTGKRELNRDEKAVAADIEAAVRQAIADGYRIFIYGGAMGADILAAETVLKLKSEYPGIKLMAALPFENSDAKFNKNWKARYANVLAQSDWIGYAGDNYTSNKLYQERNEWMIDHANRVIAVYNGSNSGGTGATVRYAKSKGIDVQVLAS